MATIQKRGDSYRIRVSDGYDVHGKQIMRSMTWTPPPEMTERQAKKEVNRQAVLFENSKLAASGNIKFEVFAEQFFHDCVDNGKLKENTRDSYRRMTKRTYAAIGHLRVDKVTHAVVQRFINNLQEPGIKHTKTKTCTGKETLSEKTVRNYLSFVSTIMSYAVDLEMIPSNPCHNIKIAKTKKEKRKVYTAEDVQQILNAMQADAPLVRYAFFVLIASIGYRKGEGLGLTWDNIDFNTGVISIKQESEYTKEKGVYTDSPKSESSVRCLKLPAEIIEILRKLHLQESENKLKVGDQWNDQENHVFVNDTGRFLANSSMYNWLNRYCQKHGFNFYGLHSFRHFAATQMVYHGIDVETVSGVLGHSNATITLNIYTHEVAYAKAAAVKQVVNAIQTSNDQTTTKLNDREK
ncbi:MAG TPA: site-specific integrase [Ruminococcaceae bacterium]|nr:site-specific integrase [Oscillospiraceae bacterium]